MKTSLITIIIGFFLVILVLNVYFRVKVMKIYKKLVQGGVEFDASHVFSSEKLHSEILPRYPEHREDIILFISEMKKSIQFASIFIALIFIVGLILKRM